MKKCCKNCKYLLLVCDDDTKRNVKQYEEDINWGMKFCVIGYLCSHPKNIQRMFVSKTQMVVSLDFYCNRYETGKEFKEKRRIKNEY